MVTGCGWHMQIRASLLFAVLLLSGCDLAPDYRVPSTPQPAAFKETGPWVTATAATALPHQAWWTLYGDATLNGLEARIDTANPTLAQAQARYDAARGYLEEAQAPLLPSLSIGGHADADKQSANRPLRSASQPTYYGDNMAAADVSWDIDLWGKVRNLIKAGKAQAQASEDDLAAVRLSLEAQLADDYLQLRELDAQAALLRDAGGIYGKAQALTNYRHDKGIASGLDVSRATTQYEDAQAQLSDTLGRRALIEHAIASLVGEAASQFALAEQVVKIPVPNLPAGIPSTLLQRRPDVASAERQVAATNAGIGVARAAFYPDISLSALAGFQNTGSNALFTAPNAFWALGPTVAVSVFDNGANERGLTVAKAANANAAAAYRGAVLKAFQEVEDNLALLNRLADASDAKSKSVAAATKTQQLALALYRNGALGFLDVVVAQTTALQAQQAELTLQTRRLEASVDLIKAVGGGWEAPPALAAASQGNKT
jgi:NodT family efflux transporter outer membrane factor (OMF) lipoprotein